MKSNSLITAGLVAVGLISAVDAFAVGGTLVTCTGSTAFRAVFFTACTTPGAVFASAASGAPADPVDLLGLGNGANKIVYEGYLKNADNSYTKYDLDCSFTGSEAGIAAIAVQALRNDTPSYAPSAGNTPPFTEPMPNVPPQYLDPVTGFTTSAAAGSIVSDLAMSDTSQAVSLTKKVVNTATDLVPGGIVGIVPFVWMKNKNSTPGTGPVSWPHITNITHPAAHLAMTGPQPPRLFTGNPVSVDPDTEAVYVVGRNKGSGTHVNQLLDSGFGFSSAVQVDQWTVRAAYNGSGVLTFTTVGAFTDADLFEVGNDGFDGGGDVSKSLQCDGGGAGVTSVLIGFMGMSDAIGLDGTGGAKAGGAVLLTLDGVAESNATVETGAYTAWGHENIYGRHGLSLTTDPAGKVMSKLITGIPSAMGTLGWGTVAATQNAGIPTTLMLATKAGDTGYPTP